MDEPPRLIIAVANGRTALRSRVNYPNPIGLVIYVSRQADALLPSFGPDELDPLDSLVLNR
jgi:hypothetical protein